MGGRGRGRSRGRAQQEYSGGPPGGGGYQGSSGGGGYQGPPPQGPRPGGAWGPPPGGRNAGPRMQQAPAAPQGAWGQRQQLSQPRAQQPQFQPRPQQQYQPSQQQQYQLSQQQQYQQRQQQPAPAHGRATYREGGGDTASGPQEKPMTGFTSGGGDSGVSTAHTGRGGNRGRRTLPDSILVTKPEGCKKHGETGRRVHLQANYFALVAQPDWCLYQYRVDFAPEEDLTSLKKKMMRDAVRELSGNKREGHLFDGTLLYLARKLPNNITELFAKHPNSEVNTRITIKLVGDVRPADYTYLQVFNIILRKCMTYLELQLVGRNFHDPKARIVIAKHNLELWPGYVTSIRQHENQILLCCEITHKVMRQDTVYSTISEVMNETRGSDFRERFKQSVIGQIVMTGYNNKTYRIDDVDFDMSPISTFKKSDGTNITFMKYYSDRYAVNIQHTKQPLLISKAKPREIRAGMCETILLVPELCRMTGLTDRQRSNFNLMRDLSEHTRVGPAQRIEKLYSFAKRMAANEKIVTELKQWDLGLAQKIVEFSGRVLTNEKIIGGAQRMYPSGADVDWTRELRTSKMYQEVPIKYWVVIYASRLKVSVQKFVKFLEQAAAGMKWQLGPARPLEIADDRIMQYMSGLDQAFNNGKPELVMCVASNNKNDRYAAIKRKCCVDNGIPSQVICAKNLDSKGALSIATKVAIQMNCKVGGAPWTVNIPLSGLMVIGFDVCHDPQNKSRSYGAVVASLNRSLTRYYSGTTHHSNGEELSNTFSLHVIQSVKRYEKVNGTKPERILIYRDGVGDGQLPYVFSHEVEHIKAALHQYYGAPVKMAFLVVSKRINTRIFSNGKNPEPGTVVDNDITLPERFDFFIVSQCTRQGTVSPTSYNILYDAMGLPVDKIQILTYKMTHMYFNWSGTVRVPAPCQYAHKLAFLVSQSLQRQPHPELETLLYYL